MGRQAQYNSVVRKPVVLITGAGGEIGHGLITRLADQGNSGRSSPSISRGWSRSWPARRSRGHRLDPRSRPARALLAEFEVDLIFHLAALLSTRSEFTPVAAHQVNVEGTLNLLEFAQHEGESHGRPVVFLYPSSIAAYGLPDVETKARGGRVKEDEWLHPTTMYGCNKLYCEQLGTLLRAALQAARARAGERPGGLPLRAVSGADLGADRALGGHVRLRARDDPRGREGGSGMPASCGPTRASRSWRCPTASRRCMRLAEAPRERLTRTAYNVTAFNPSAEEIRDVVIAAFPEAQIAWAADTRRQGIVDSWPADVDDSTARADWGYAPRYDFDRAFAEYLIPSIRQRYAQAAPGGP
jgi:threonine 3-dehydrogenase